jgi:hypothetical protein
MEIYKIYKGKRLGTKENLSGVLVTINEFGKDKLLIHQVHHSPTGFEWGYMGSGPADLARSIIWDFIGKEPSPQLYQEFKREFVSGWKDEWKITSEQIREWIINTFGKTYYNYLTEIADPRD